MTQELTSSSKIGLAIIVLEEIGPQTIVNLSKLDEISEMYLAVKGFTAFMTGFETTQYGPGKIRGILQIPNTDCFAVAMDINIRGTGFEEDERLQINRNGAFCLIADSKQLEKIRKYYNQTEVFLIQKLKSITSLNHLNVEFCQKILDEYNDYLDELLNSEPDNIQSESEVCYSLFEVGLLLSLPQDENKTARVILEYSVGEKEGVNIDKIKKITKRKRKDEQTVIDKLLAKGLIIAIPPKEAGEDIHYIAH